MVNQWQMLQQVPMAYILDYVFISKEDVLCCCFDSDNRMSSTFVRFFSRKTDSIYIDNCANCHLTNNRSHFVTYRAYKDAEVRKMSLICGHTKAVGDGIVCWIWRADCGQTCTYKLPHCKYYPESPVCILLQTQLGLFSDTTTLLPLSSQECTRHFFAGEVTSL